MARRRAAQPQAWCAAEVSVLCRLPKCCAVLDHDDLWWCTPVTQGLSWDTTVRPRGCRGGVPSHRHLTSVPVSTAIRAPPVVALNRNPPRRAGSTRCQTAPLEADRSSSQSALSERPGRWNGRVSERRQPLPSERGGVYDLPSCPACEGMLGRSESPPRRGRRREGRTTVSAGGPQLRAALPSRREASALGAEPQRAPSHTPHAASGWNGIASESPRPARVFRERSGSEGPS